MIKFSNFNLYLFQVIDLLFLTMGTYANKTCYQCGIRRPVNLMKRKTIRKDTGSSGWSASFNLQKKNSLRFYTPRKRYTNVEKYFCKHDAAHGKLDYYGESEKKSDEIKIKIEKLQKQKFHQELVTTQRKEEAKKRKKENERINQRNEEYKQRKERSLQDRNRKDYIKKTEEQKIAANKNRREDLERLQKEKAEKHLILKSFNKLIREKIDNFIKENKDTENTQLSSKTLNEISNIVLKYRYPNINIQNIKKNTNILRYYFIPSFILPLFIVPIFSDNNFLINISIANLFVSPLLLIASFIYKKSEKKLFKKFKLDLDRSLPTIIKNHFKKDFNNFQNDGHPQSNQDYNFIKVIYEELNIYEIEEPITVNQQNIENSSLNDPDHKSINNKKQNNSTNEITKKSFSDIIYREDFFELCTAYFVTKVALVDDKIEKKEKEYIKNFFKNFTDEEFNIVDLFQKQFNDQIICDIIKKKFGDNITLLEDLINNLFGISESDGEISNDEVQYISKIATNLGLTKEQFESIKNHSNTKNIANEDSEYNYNEEDFDDFDNFIDALNED